jgi:MEMO1 family protein
MTDYNAALPKLRPIDMTPLQYEGSAYLLLRDPLGLIETTLLIPQPMIPLLALCDGSRNPAALRAALAVRYGIVLSLDRIEESLRALDDAYLLENERSHQARELAQSAYRQAPFRPPASAGAAYPEEPQALAATLQGYLDQVNESSHSGHANGHVRGVISPHIDFERGGLVYAQVWSQAAEAVRNADLAVIFGTDHFSEGFPITLTRQNYATPFGVLPTDTKIVDTLAQVLGEEQAFAGELHHRREHSIELAAIWLHYIRNRQPIDMIPILTGSLTHNNPGFDLESLLEALRGALHGRRVVVVAAGDLAHVGPAFDTEPVDPKKMDRLKIADDELVQAMCAGSAENFFAAIQRVQDENNVCGVTPIYLTLRLLAPLKGHNHGYAICPADQNQTSVVSICGVTLE